jgi:hypothetical protein
MSGLQSFRIRRELPDNGRGHLPTKVLAIVVVDLRRRDRGVSGESRDAADVAVIPGRRLTPLAGRT